MTPSKNFLLPAFYTGLIAGTMDLAGAVISYLIVNGRFPYKILEYIASAAFGKKVMDGSVGANLWGLFFHYFIAISFTVFYFFIYPQAKFLQKNIFLSAVTYGIFAWIVTNMIVLPISALQSPVIPANLVAAARAAFVLMICIGLPTAYFAKRFYAR